MAGETGNRAALLEASDSIEGVALVVLKLVEALLNQLFCSRQVALVAEHYRQCARGARPRGWGRQLKSESIGLLHQSAAVHEILEVDVLRPDRDEQLRAICV